MPGQVHTYFGGSEHNIFRAYRQEVFQISHWDEKDRIAGLEKVLDEMGLKVARQPYQFPVAGEVIQGTNVYALLRGPRADATEAMVLIAAWKNFEGEINYSGVALALTLARYFKRWSIWSKDIIILIPTDSTYGPEAWATAYHSTSLEVTAHRNITALPIKAGALQAAVALDYPVGPWGHRFDKLDILYDGINGALPNLDLLNTAVSVASGQMGIACCLHGLTSHSDSYMDRLATIAKGLTTQAAGHATGPHSAFMPYHVDAITLKTVGDGWHDEMSLGRTTESIFRSINNLLEHLHQSFFFYILLNPNRFVSIGNYLPAAMLIAGNFTITALALWAQSGQVRTKPTVKSASTDKKVNQPARMAVNEKAANVALVPEPAMETEEREMFLPAIVTLGVHVLSVVPLHLLSSVQKSHMTTVHYGLLGTSIVLPAVISALLVRLWKVSLQQLQIMQSFSLLLLSAELSTLATLNFSLAFVIGIMSSPLSFVRPIQRPAQNISTWEYAIKLAVSIVAVLVYNAVCPPGVLSFASDFFDKPMDWLLLEMARGWNAQGVYTAFVIWALWWPVWVICGIVLYSGTFMELQ